MRSLPLDLAFALVKRAREPLTAIFAQVCMIAVHHIFICRSFSYYVSGRILAKHTIELYFFLAGHCMLTQIFHCFARLAKTTPMIGQPHSGHDLRAVFIKPFCGKGAVALHPAE